MLEVIYFVYKFVGKSVQIELIKKKGRKTLTCASHVLRETRHFIILVCIN
jgi:hypothetical protein